jgi:4-hydroxy-2-oxoglutarate aldolase
MDLAGVFPPVTTPFKDGELDLAALGRNLDRYMGTGVRGIVVLGSNGEAPHLTGDESERVIAAARDHVPRGRPLIAGAGHDATPVTIAAAGAAARAGADLVLVKTPGYYRSQASPEFFLRHFTAVADASPVPVLIYDAPMFTGVAIAPPTVAKLAEHPNIVGIKESAPDIASVADFVSSTPAGFQVLVGSAPTLYASLCVGAVGGIVALACVVPDLCVRLHALVREQRHREALDLQRRLTPLARSVTTVFGIGGLKAAMDAAGFAGGEPRLPLVRPSAAGLEAIRAQIAELQAV